MRTFSLVQPLASLICCGVADAKSSSAITGRLLPTLIHANSISGSITEDNQEKFLPTTWIWDIENYKIMGVLPVLNKNLPVNAILGVAYMEICQNDEDSLWTQHAQRSNFRWVFSNGRLFKKPILNVKHNLGLFDFHKIKEDNLPPFIEMPCIKREGKALRIPLARYYFEQVVEGKIRYLTFYLTQQNVEEFADPLTYLPYQTEIVTFISDSQKISKRLKGYTTDILTDDSGTGKYAEFSDVNGTMLRKGIAILEF